MKPLPFFLILIAVTFLRGHAHSAQPAAVRRAVPAAALAPTSGTNSATGEERRLGGYVLDTEKHKLAPGDRISFRISEDREPQVSLTITESGELDVPYAGPGYPPLRVKATAMTCQELALELKRLLEQDFYYSATVVIGLDAISKVRGKVYIWGQVRTQGAIEIPTGENFTVGKAILRAGGFGEFANKQKVKLIRTLPDDTKKEEILNMEEIFDKGKTEKDKNLQDGDFILVPEKIWNL